MKWTLDCALCGKQEKFGDSKDITIAKWQIIAWDVKTAEPRVVCPNCEYGKKKEK